MRLLVTLTLILLPGLALAQTNSAPPFSDEPRLILVPNLVNPRAPTGPQATIDQLTQTNAELLDLLKKQQSVLEDIQFDRRLQSRQIESLEERLQETLVENTQLQNKIDKLTAAANNPGAATAAPAATTNATAANQPAPNAPPPPEPAPAKPSSYLPIAPVEVASAAAGWHRLFTLSGSDSRNTDLFQIKGTHWRVLWHNQDPDGKAYVNTSALFLNAFPKDDTIPQKVSAKLGSGGDVTDLVGPGNYYLKIEASGGSWELAVEDFH